MRNSVRIFSDKENLPMVPQQLLVEAGSYIIFEVDNLSVHSRVRQWLRFFFPFLDGVAKSSMPFTITKDTTLIKFHPKFLICVLSLSQPLNPLIKQPIKQAPDAEVLVVTTAGAPGKNLAAGAPNAHGATHAGATNAAANAANGGASRAWL